MTWLWDIWQRQLGGKPTRKEESENLDHVCMRVQERSTEPKPQVVVEAASSMLLTAKLSLVPPPLSSASDALSTARICLFPLHFEAIGRNYVMEHTVATVPAPATGTVALPVHTF